MKKTYRYVILGISLSTIASAIPLIVTGASEYNDIKNNDIKPPEDKQLINSEK